MKLFGLFGERPEEPNDDDDGSEDTLSSRLEKIARSPPGDGVPEGEKMLHMHVAKSIDPELL